MASTYAGVVTGNAFTENVQARLAQIAEQGLLRQLRKIESPQTKRIAVEGRSVLNFSSNDYLGLANHPLLKAAAAEAIERYGAGAGASRLICGSLGCHHALEQALAEFKNTEAALTFATGYSAALGALTSLLDKDDIVVIDKLVHASIIDAARLCGATMRVFRHNDLNHLQDILRWTDRQRIAPHSPKRRPHVLVVTESVFSMDGDRAPLREIVALKEQHGAWLMIDDAHATGVIGRDGRGLIHELGLTEAVEIQMGTLGKAIGASGGYLCGCKPWIELLINRARSFIFSTAPVPAAVAAARAGIELLQSDTGTERQQLLWERVHQLHAGLRTHSSGPESAILPFIAGPESRALELAARLDALGLFAPAIRYPTVPRGQARLRITVTAEHASEEIALLVSALHEHSPRAARE